MGDRVFVPPEIIDLSVGCSKQKKVRYSKQRPSGFDKAVVRLITFNLFGDGLEVFKKSKPGAGSVYAISLTVKDSLNKLRNTPAQTYRLMTIPSSEGVKSNPVYRNCLGIIEEAINEEGKKGFYLVDEEEGILYHYYYGIHCHCFDLIGTMQFYDRSSCGSGNLPCFQYNCAAGVFNPIVNRYTFPEHNIAKATSFIKSIGRFATHFDTGSICRAGPLIAAYANEMLYSHERYPHKDIVRIVEKYLKKTLSSRDRTTVQQLFNFYNSLGSNLFLHVPIESGNEEKKSMIGYLIKRILIWRRETIL